MNITETEIQKQLFALQDLEYKAFQCKLMPTVQTETVIGVRTPALRALAKILADTPESTEFLQILPHHYYEENNLHGFLIAGKKEYATVIADLEAFLPYVDNWATCDLLSPLIFKKHLSELYEQIQRWLQSDHLYTVRFGVGMLLGFYLDTAFRPEMLTLVASVKSTEYYINMMIAWYFATALVKQVDAALPYIQEGCLEKWTHNKTIQKAVESYRISPEMKECLRAMKK